MIILDTNVVSELFKPAPNAKVIEVCQPFRARLTSPPLRSLRLSTVSLP